LLETCALSLEFGVVAGRMQVDDQGRVGAEPLWDVDAHGIVHAVEADIDLTRAGRR
jgi:hypothetical protein